ncbi:hypothetical protein AGLY_009189, partial [Aphis glycines]
TEHRCKRKHIEFLENKCLNTAQIKVEIISQRLLPVLAIKTVIKTLKINFHTVQLSKRATELIFFTASSVIIIRHWIRKYSTELNNKNMTIFINNNVFKIKLKLNDTCINTEYNSTKIVCEQRRVYGEGANKISFDERSRAAFGKTYFLANYTILYILYSINGVYPFVVCIVLGV